MQTTPTSQRGRVPSFTTDNDDDEASFWEECERAAKKNPAPQRSQNQHKKTVDKEEVIGLMEHGGNFFLLLCLIRASNVKCGTRVTFFERACCRDDYNVMMVQSLANKNVALNVVSVLIAAKLY